MVKKATGFRGTYEQVWYNEKFMKSVTCQIIDDSTNNTGIFQGKRLDCET